MYPCYLCNKVSTCGVFLFLESLTAGVPTSRWGLRSSGSLGGEVTIFILWEKDVGI